MAIFEPQDRREKYLQAAAMVVAVIVTAIFAYTVTGLYRWLLELQVVLFGGHRAGASFLLSVILLWIPQAAAIRWWCSHKIDRPSETPPQFAEQPAAPIIGFATWVYRRLFFTLPGQVFLLGWGVVVITFIMQLRAGSMTHLRTMTIQELEGGVVPDSDWLQISGVALIDEAVAIQGITTHNYIPVTSDPAAPSAAVSLYLKLLERKGWPAPNGPFEGIVDPRGLPSLAKLEFEKAGLPPAANAIVLDFGGTPSQARANSRRVIKVGTIIGLVGTGLLALSLLVGLFHGDSA